MVIIPQITFGHEYVLTHGRIMQRFFRREQNRKIRLLFNGGRSVEVSCNYELKFNKKLCRMFDGAYVYVFVWHS